MRRARLNAWERSIHSGGDDAACKQADDHRRGFHDWGAEALADEDRDEDREAKTINSALPHARA